MHVRLGRLVGCNILELIMQLHVLLADVAWVLFIVVMLVRPLNDIRKWGLCLKGMKWRKYLGIATGVFAFLHVILFLYGIGLGWSFLVGPVWNFTTLLGWGMLALILLIPPFITSNCFSQRLLRGNWKKVQMISYFAFWATGIHIALVADRWWLGIIPLLVWAVVWFWAAYLKKKRVSV